MKKNWKLQKIEDWQVVAKEVSGLLQAGVWVRLVGPLGAGKTSFVRSLLKEWGVEGVIPSPTYPLVLEYEFEDLKVIHLDAYRLEGAQELGWDWREWEACLVFAEWPEKTNIPLNRFQFELRIELSDNGVSRRVEWIEKT